MAEPVERTRNHHVEGGLGLSDPTHAMSKPRRSQAVLAEQMTLAATSEHLAFVDAKILDQNFGMTGRAVHRFYLANLIPTDARDIDEEGRVSGAGLLGIVFGPDDQNGEIGSVGV